MTVSTSELPHEVGTYGIALRGTKAGQEIADNTSTWTPLRYAPVNEQHPLTPKVQAAVSGQGRTPRFIMTSPILNQVAQPNSASATTCGRLMGRKAL